MAAKDRFSSVSEEDLTKIKEDSRTESSVKATRCWSSLFLSYIEHKKIEIVFKTCSATELADILKKFYVEVWRQDRSVYQRSSIRGRRAAIHRFIREPPYSRMDLSLFRGNSAFDEDNDMLDDQLRVFKKRGELKATRLYPQYVRLTRVKRSLRVVNFKRRIASFAWRASSSAFAQRTRPSCIQHCLPLNARRASRPTFAVRGYPMAQRCVLRCSVVTAPQHSASRQAPPLPRRLRAEPKINGRLSDARLDKPWFPLKAQVFADSSASATTLACSSLLANLARVLQKGLCSLSLPSLLPWLAPSCENATLQQRHQARERMTQLPAATSKQLSGMANVIFARLAAQLNSSLLQGATIAPHRPLAVVYGREHPKLSGGPGVDATGLSLTKERAEAAFTTRPAAGSSDDLAFQQQTAVSSVSSTSPLGRHCAGFCHTDVLTKLPTALHLYPDKFWQLGLMCNVLPLRCTW